MLYCFNCFEADFMTFPSISCIRFAGNGSFFAMLLTKYK